MSAGKRLDLSAKNILLRPVKAQDAPIIHQSVYLNPDFMHLFRIANGPVTEQQVRQNIESRYQKPFQRQNYQEFLIQHKQRQILGIAALAGVSFEHQRGEIMLGLFKPEHRVYSNALEATLLLLHYGFNVLGLNRMDSLIYAHNLHAQKSTLALGFSFEGIRKEYVYSLKDQAFIDLNSYALLKKDFVGNPRLTKLSKKLLAQDITVQTPAKPHSPPLLRAIESHTLVKPTLP